MSEAAEPNGFRAFYRACHAEQVRRAYLLVGSHAVADELVHDAFLAVYERWSEIREPAAYLNRTVANACRRHGRRRARVDVGQGSESVAAGLEAVPDAASVEVEMASLLLTLPFRQRAAVVLRFYAGMTENEIAAVLECRPGTVGPAIHRGLAKLRKELE